MSAPAQAAPVAGAELGAVVAAGAEVPSFSDVDLTHKFHEPIWWLADHGVTSGFADGTYRPAADTTRGQMAAFLYRFAGEPAFTAPVTSPFADVPVSHKFYQEICWLSAEGITSGYPDGTFKASRSVTRGQMAAFLYRFAERPAFSAPSSPTFSDVPVSHSFFKAVEWLAETGVTTGYASGAFGPSDEVTRGAMAAFLWRFDDWADPPERVTTEESSASAIGWWLISGSNPSLSADGRWLAFGANGWTSTLDNVPNVLVKDRESGVVQLVSRTSGGDGGSSSSHGMISADGETIVFQSLADDLVPGMSGGHWQVYVADRASGDISLVSHATDGTPGDANSFYGDISPDGTLVAFTSGAQNLLEGTPSGYVMDTGTGELRGVEPAGVLPVISADGRWYAFCGSVGPGLGYGDVIALVDRTTDEVTVVAELSDQDEETDSCESLDISDDGSIVAFTSWASLHPAVPDGFRALYAWDRTTGETTLVSVGTYGSPANGWSLGASISADGRWITYSSSASNLAPRDPNRTDVYVTDRVTGATALVSAAVGGAAGNAWSSIDRTPRISADGRWITYVSAATDLVAGDTNGSYDVFVTSNPLLR